jgi:hypothetical protein
MASAETMGPAEAVTSAEAMATTAMATTAVATTAVATTAHVDQRIISRIGMGARHLGHRRFCWTNRQYCAQNDRRCSCHWSSHNILHQIPSTTRHVARVMMLRYDARGCTTYTLRSLTRYLWAGGGSERATRESRGHAVNLCQATSCDAASSFGETGECAKSEVCASSPGSCGFFSEATRTQGERHEGCD